MADTPAPSQGQAPAPGGATSLPDTANVSNGPVFEYTYADGKKEVYNTKDDLTKAWRDSFLRHSDYTRKTQEHANERKKFDEERKKFQDEMKAFQESKKRYDNWDQILKTRPDIYQQLERSAMQPASPEALFQRTQGLVEESLNPYEERIGKLEKMLEQQRTDKEIDEVVSKLSSEYPDFERDSIMEALESIADGKTEPLFRMLYFANKGRTPLQAEEKVVQNLEKKQRAAMVPAGGTTPKSSPAKHKSLDDAAKAAMKDYGIT